MDWSGPRGALSCQSHAAGAANHTSGRLFPRDLARGRRLRDRPRRHGQTDVPGARTHLRRASRVDRARVLSDDDPLSPRPPLHAIRALPRCPAAERSLRTAVQRAPRPVWPSLRRPLHLKGHRRGTPPAGGMPIRRRESRSGRNLRLRRRLAVGPQPLRRNKRVRATGRACGRRTSRPRSRRPSPARVRAGAISPPREPPRARVAARDRSVHASPRA